MGMFDFRDIQAAQKSEQIRAYSVEQALEHFQRSDPSAQDLINVAKMIEDYITSGDTSNTITSAVDEGVREGRMEVKEVIEKWLPLAHGELDELYKARGWIPNRPEPGTTLEY